MSKVTYNGHNFQIKPNGLCLYNEKGYDIFDEEGYRLVENFKQEKLKQFQRAIEVSGEGDSLKIVLDFAPYDVDSHTLRNNKGCHSLWVKPEYKELSKFWTYLRLM